MVVSSGQLLRSPKMFLGWEQVTREQVITNLRSLKDLFSIESNWITWPEAENASGKETNPSSPDAVRWCLSGASEKITRLSFPIPLCDFIDCATREYINDLSDETFIKGILSYQDEFALICLALDELEKENV